jgi:hypothetical protein
LQPLKHHAAQQTFIDIAEDHHNPEDIDRVLSLTDNMPLAINLIAIWWIWRDAPVYCPAGMQREHL